MSRYNKYSYLFIKNILTGDVIYRSIGQTVLLAEHMLRLFHKMNINHIIWTTLLKVTLYNPTNVLVRSHQHD